MNKIDFQEKAAQNIARFLLECAKNCQSMWNGGNQWGQYVSFLSFFRHVCKLDLDYSKWDHYEKAAIHSGPRIMTADFCMVADRPEFIHVDERNLPHCEDGPYCRWRDGFALWYIHGVKVNRLIVERPDLITTRMIEDEENAEVRRVMLDRFGWDRYLQETDSEKIAEDEFGTLYRKEIPDDEDLVMVQVTNSTPEPDGSRKKFFLRVDPDAYNGAAGKVPQAAVASTWRDRETKQIVLKDYRAYQLQQET